MIEPSSALEAVLNFIPTLEREWVTLDQAQNRVLASPIHADRDYPPFDRVCMDGIAVKVPFSHASPHHLLSVQGIQGAGEPPLTLISSDHCIEVMTGAVVPTEANSVIPYENLEKTTDSFILKGPGNPKLGENIQTQGSDFKINQELLQPGQVLKPQHIILAATCGYTRLPVFKFPQIHILATGSELIEVEADPKPYQLRHTNDLSIRGILADWGFPVASILFKEDQQEILTRSIENSLSTADVLIISGGVSKGQFDFIPAILENLGCQKIFHLVKQKPGKPLWFGTITNLDGKVRFVFGLPGNPVAVQVNTVKYIIPFLCKWINTSLPIPILTQIIEDLNIKPKMRVYIPAKIFVEQGKLFAVPKPTGGSGDFFSLKDSTGMLECPEGPVTLPKGTLLPYISWGPSIC